MSGDMKESLECHLQALEIRKQLNNKHQIGYSHVNLGIVYRDLGKDHLVLYHLNEGLEIMREIKERSSNEFVVREFQQMLDSL